MKVCIFSEQHIYTTNMEGSLFEPTPVQNGGVLKRLEIPLWHVVVAIHPWLMLTAITIVSLAGFALRKQLAPAKEKTDMESKTADGRFTILNEDWDDEIVLAIDDAEVPEVIRRHGARFRNPARYAIALGHGEYLLYGGDGELLDMCALK